ncbi:hypothetical protein A249_38759, partial [Pseudomonas syringae pv. actinidiae ICMP 18804]
MIFPSGFFKPWRPGALRQPGTSVSLAAWIPPCCCIFWLSSPGAKASLRYTQSTFITVCKLLPMR